MFLWNVLLAIIWAFATGNFSASHLLIGFVLGFVVLWMGRDIFGASAYCVRVVRIIALVFYFLWALILANLRVARDVVTPSYKMRPGIIAVPLDAETDFEILLFANMLTLTPGTLCLDVSDDRRTLYVHSMFISDVDEEKRFLKDTFERRLLEVMR